MLLVARFAVCLLPYLSEQCCWWLGLLYVYFLVCLNSTADGHVCWLFAALLIVCLNSTTGGCVYWLFTALLIVCLNSTTGGCVYWLFAALLNSLLHGREQRLWPSVPLCDASSPGHQGR